MMNHWRIAAHSLRHYWLTGLAMIAGVAIATAVLTGALLVGDSMRGSLMDLSLDRLGEIDDLVVSDGFFREQLADETEARYDLAAPAILFNNGTVEISDGSGNVRRAINVNVFGVEQRFWKLDSHHRDLKMSDGRNVILNHSLADLVGATAGDSSQSLTLRIPKPTQLPAESALGAKRDLVESLTGLSVDQVIDDRGLGGFGLQPSQTTSPNIFVPIELLQDALSRGPLAHKSDSAQANVMFLAGQTTDSKFSVDQLSPTLEDCGLTLKRVTRTFDGTTLYDQWQLSSDRLVISDALAQTIAATFPDSQPIYTYLANDIRTENAESGIPFSMIAAMNFGGDFSPQSAISKQPIGNIADDEIVLNEWAAKDLNVEPGDTVVVSYYEPESTHGQQVERSVSLVVADVARLVEPSVPPEVRRREVVPAEFDSPPALANDPDLTPVVPGVTDARSIENWDLPFETAGKIRPADDDYWEQYRTTPKGFVSLATGQELWDSRFGSVTAFRFKNSRSVVPANAKSDNGGDHRPTIRTVETIREDLLKTISTGDDSVAGFHFVPIRRSAIAAASGSTPFDALFLALSMFVIASALILVSLLFRLTLQSRISETGLLAATGWRSSAITRLWLREMLVLCGIGTLLGLLLGVGYAALMIVGLRTWWVGAISKPFIQLHVGPLSLLIGGFSGLLVCLATIWWTLRKLGRRAVPGLLAGESDDVVTPGSSTSEWDQVLGSRASCRGHCHLRFSVHADR